MSENWIRKFLGGFSADPVSAEKLRKVASKVRAENAVIARDESGARDAQILADQVESGRKRKLLETLERAAEEAGIISQFSPGVLEFISSAVSKLHESSIRGEGGRVSYTLPWESTRSVNKYGRYHGAPEYYPVLNFPMVLPNGSQSTVECNPSAGRIIAVLSNMPEYKQFADFCKKQGYRLRFDQKTYGRSLDFGDAGSNHSEVRHIELDISIY